MEYRYRDASEMKDSRVEWIGKIPKDWEINKLKNISSIYGRIGFRGYTVNDLVSEGEGAITLSPSNIEEQKLKLDKLTYISWEKYEESPEIKVYNEDIVFVKTASVGKVAYIEGLLEKATINPQFVVFKNIKMNKKLLYYILVSNVIQEQINSGINGGVVSTLTQQDINNYYIPYQNNIEQEKIANFLDKKTLQFDSIISKKEALIEKLEEAKKSLISEVVTGKVKVVKTDDGYELVKRISEEMKDSGVEWLGEIPKDWDIMKAARIASIVRGGSPRPAGDPKYFGGNEVPWITVAEVTKDDNKFLNSVSSYLTLLGKEQSRYLEKGTLVMSNSGATLGVPKILNISGCINDGSLAFLNLNMNKNYLYYLLKSRTEIFRKEMQISGQPNLNTDVVKSLYILKPQYKEEDIISKYLDNKTNDINILIEKVKIQIQKLKQAKQSLISEAVTGKIEILD